MVTRDSDARNDIEDTRGPLLGFRNKATGELIELDDSRFPEIAQRYAFKAAPPLTPEEQTRYAGELQTMLDNGELNYPNLAQTMLARPETLFMLPEMGFAYGSTGVGDVQAMNDLAAESISAVLNSAQAPYLVAEYQNESRHDDLQQMFWSEIAVAYDQDARDAFLSLMASLDEQGTARVASRALVYAEGMDLSDELVRSQVYYYVHTEAYKQQQWELMNTGAGGFFDTLENAKDTLAEGAINVGLTAQHAMLGTPEDAIRRSGLTVGEQIAFQMGLRPTDDTTVSLPWFGQVGTWDLISGIWDGYSEFAHDPLNIIASFGLGLKAIRTVPMGAQAVKATKLGKAVAAARAFVVPTRRGAGVAKGVPGGRVSRTMYVLRGKGIEDFMDTKQSLRVIEDFQKLAREGNRAEMLLRHPKLSQMPDEAIDIIAHLDSTVEDAAETIKGVMMNDIHLSGELLDVAQRAKVRLWERVGRQIDKGEITETTRTVSKGDRQVIEENIEVLRRVIVGDVQPEDVRQMIEKGRGMSPLHKDIVDEVLGDLSLTELTPKMIEDIFATKIFDRESVIQDMLTRAQGQIADILGDDIWHKGAWSQLDYALGGGELAARKLGRDPDMAALDLFEEVLVGVRSGTQKGGRVFVASTPVRPAGRMASAELLEYVNKGVDPALLKEAMLAEARYLQAANKVEKFYLVGDALTPLKKMTRAKFINAMQNMPVIGGPKAASTAARMTPGAPRGSIALFDVRKATDDLDALFKHYGVAREKYMPVINDFLRLDEGARQDFIFEVALPLIGEERGIGILKHNLLQLYRSGKLRQFSNQELDIWVDAVGESHRGPIFAYQFTNEVPIPIHTIDQILMRVNIAGRKGIKLRTHGLLGSTNSRRAGIAKRFKERLAKEGVKVTDEEAYSVGFSMLSDVGDDGRGWFAAKLLQKAGGVWDKQHNFFKMSMLLLRPGPWAMRVLFEEHLRGFVSNLSSLARNPFEHLWGMRQASILRKAVKSRAVLVESAQGYIRTVTEGAASSAVVAERLGGLAEAVFPKGTPETLSEARRLVNAFMSQAVSGAQDLRKLKPLGSVRKAARSAARNQEKADKLLANLGLKLEDIVTPDKRGAFDLIQQQQISRGFIAEAASIFSPAPSLWRPGMLADESMAHGQRLAFHVLKAVEDQMGKMAVLRLADRLAGVAYGADRTASAVVSKSSWRLLGSDMHRRFGDADDLVLAERYMDEILTPEIEYLLEPFLKGRSPAEQAATLRRLVDDKVLDSTVGGVNVSIDLNHAKSGATRMGELVTDASDNIRWPDLATVPVDPRFTDVNPTIARRMLRFFGDELSQKLNRRPSWLKSFKRWKEHFTDLGLDEYNANKAAKARAVDEVNSVYFDAEMAPHLMKRMERAIPFIKATYEVASQWTYKMPVAAGGYWPLGIGEFARKLDRMLQALVETGAVTVEEDADGNRSGFVLHTLGKDITLGDPLNPTTFGLLSFFQFAVGASPPGTYVASKIKAAIPAAGNDRREASVGETWGELADRLGADPVELARLNRTLFYDHGLGKTAYLSIMGQVADLDDIQVPEGLPVRIPESGLVHAIEDLLIPMGEIGLADMPMQYFPATMRNMFVALVLGFTPADEFWESGEIAGLTGFIPKQFESSVMSQAAEQMMYLEASDLADGVGPIARMMAKEVELATLEGEAAEEKRAELEQDHADYILAIKEGVVSAMWTKGLLGQLMPTSPRASRENAVEINSYWGSREFADSAESGEGKLKLLPFENVKQIEDFYELANAWLADDTGEGAKATFRRQHPELLAYLTPKTYFGQEGVPPEIGSFDDYADQIKSGERITPPPVVTAIRYYQSSIPADFNVAYISRYGNDPTEAAAAALYDREGYRQLTDKRADQYMAIDMFDDMNGGVYEQWRKDRKDPEDWALDRLIDRRRELQGALATLMELAEDEDATLDTEELREDVVTFRKAFALVGQSIRALQDDEELAKFRNPFEEAYYKYFEEYYIPYNEGLSALYDIKEGIIDSERAQLIYEEIRDYRNEATLEPVYIDGVQFPNASDYHWTGKQEEEQESLRQVWLTRPLEWMDITQAQHILEAHPEMADYLPDTVDDYLIYHQMTVAKIIAKEQFEANEITSGDKAKINRAIDEELRRILVESGRSGEALFLDLTPFEKLQLAGELPIMLDTKEYTEWQRYYIEVLANEQKSADSIRGREIVFDFMQLLIRRTETDLAFRGVVVDLGQRLFDMEFVDQIFPKLFFDAKER